VHNMHECYMQLPFFLTATLECFKIEELFSILKEQFDLPSFHVEFQHEFRAEPIMIGCQKYWFAMHTILTDNNTLWSESIEFDYKVYNPVCFATYLNRFILVMINSFCEMCKLYICCIE